MSHYRVERLIAESLDELPESCRRCLFWELGEKRPDPRQVNGRSDDGLPDDALIQKQAWTSAQALQHAAPGRVVRLGGALAGYVLFAQAQQFARRRRPAPHVSQDALLLATAWVDPRYREMGVGRRLVQSAIKEAMRLDLPAVEVYGDRRFREQDCVLPTMWLLHEGFAIHREHPRYPLLRLETRRTVRWADALEHAWDEVTDRLPRLVPKPAPGGQPAPQGAPVPHRTTEEPPNGRRGCPR